MYKSTSCGTHLVSLFLKLSAVGVREVLKSFSHGCNLTDEEEHVPSQVVCNLRNTTVFEVDSAVLHYVENGALGVAVGKVEENFSGLSEDIDVFRDIKDTCGGT